MYVSNSNALEIPFAFKTYMAQAEEKALVDSSVAAARGAEPSRS
jgi:hypothetical protein